MSGSRSGRRSLRVLAGIGAAVLAVAGLQVALGGERAFAATTCDNTTLTNTTVVGSLNVPTGSTCVLNNVNVTGSITVSGGDLQFNGGTVDKNIQVKPGSRLEPNNTSAIVACSDDPTVAPCAPPITVMGSVIMNGVDFRSPNCPNVSIGKSLVIKNTDPPAPYSCLTVTGPATVTNSFGIGFAHSTFKSNVTLKGNNNVQFGGPDPALGNNVHGTVMVTNNQNIDVEYNTIGRNLVCSRNDPATTTIANNNVAGTTSSGCL